MNPTARFRAASGLELLLGASIVIGHNVFHVVPNEVPILFGLGLLSFRLRNGGVSAAMGLVRPASWTRTLAIAAAAAASRIALGDLVIDHLLSGRNLWASILAHGFIDTVGVTLAYFGWDS